VIAGGRTFPPRVTGAVVGAMAGQPVSFAGLLRDAMHTLDEGKRDGVALAISGVTEQGR
jgi:hypothetical protein